MVGGELSATAAWFVRGEFSQRRTHALTGLALARSRAHALLVHLHTKAVVATLARRTIVPCRTCDSCQNGSRLLGVHWTPLWDSQTFLLMVGAVG